ncbi:ABC transporter ATP-binding protein [Marinobacter halodurans]|uniref:ABC transporter ATP-binding protein n=1 Tax=Marinobacter halodurans TaxID=2528979 RepID=A0ABY1ZP09_9GAMM|nr:ATP-binding cassette domain-containing protein [Marinobacter halodurans]TBW58450.1 ABC transporter ATP-binding protein [Marinobacter halodurans]
MLELRIERLAYDRTVVEGIGASVAPGDHICLLGPSGIGKTTLLNAIAGLVPWLPAGAVIGRDRIRLAYLFQEHRLLPWRTVRQNIRLVGASDETVDRLLADVGLADHAESLPDQLSLGMARRAALARCLAIEPDLLLMDEPFASLDADRAGELRELIRALLASRPDRAMICVTHDPADAAALANRLWYLDGAPATLRWDERINGVDEVGILLDRLRGVVLA